MRRPVVRLTLLLTPLCAVACGGSSSEPPPGITHNAPAQPQAPASTPAPPAVPGAEAPPPFSVNVAPLSKDGRTPDPALPLVRELTSEFYRGELAKLHKRFSAEMKETMPIERLSAFRDRVERQFGKETELIGEDWQTRGGYRGFVRWARFDHYNGVVEVIWMLHKDDDQVAGLFVQPAENEKRPE